MIGLKGTPSTTPFLASMWITSMFFSRRMRSSPQTFRPTLSYRLNRTSSYCSPSRGYATRCLGDELLILLPVLLSVSFLVFVAVDVFHDLTDDVIELGLNCFSLLLGDVVRLAGHLVLDDVHDPGVELIDQLLSVHVLRLVCRC